jgi:hypothetical protein
MEDWLGQLNQEWQEGGDLLAQLNNSLVEPLFHSATPELLQLLTPSSYCTFRDGLL